MSCAGGTVPGGSSYLSPATLGSSAVCGSLNGGAPAWYQFSPSASAAYDTRVSGSGDAQLRMWKVVVGGYLQLPNTTATEVTGSASAGDRYLVAVFSPSAQSQTYVLSPGTTAAAPAPMDAGTPLDGGTSPSSDPSQACVDKINSLRASIGLPALQRWTSEEACVDGEAKADAQTGIPHSAFPGCGELAQNECPGWRGPASAMIGSCLDAMWAEGPGGGHYFNMTNPSYSKVACGFFTTASGAVWATQDFR
jgi:hypothetical protein